LYGFQQKRFNWLHCDTEAEGSPKIGKYLHTLCECPFFVEDAQRVISLSCSHLVGWSANYLVIGRVVAWIDDLLITSLFAWLNAITGQGP